MRRNSGGEEILYIALAKAASKRGLQGQGARDTRKGKVRSKCDVDFLRVVGSEQKGITVKNFESVSLTQLAVNLEARNPY